MPHQRFSVLQGARFFHWRLPLNVNQQTAPKTASTSIRPTLGPPFPNPEKQQLHTQARTGYKSQERGLNENHDRTQTTSPASLAKHHSNLLCIDRQAAATHKRTLLTKPAVGIRLGSLWTAERAVGRLPYSYEEAAGTNFTASWIKRKQTGRSAQLSLHQPQRCKSQPVERMPSTSFRRLLTTHLCIKYRILTESNGHTHSKITLPNTRVDKVGLFFVANFKTWQTRHSNLKKKKKRTVWLWLEIGHHTRRTKNSHKEGIKKKNNNHKAAKLKVHKRKVIQMQSHSQWPFEKHWLNETRKTIYKYKNKSPRNKKNSLHNVQPKLAQHKKW